MKDFSLPWRELRLILRMEGRGRHWACPPLSLPYQMQKGRWDVSEIKSPQKGVLCHQNPCSKIYWKEFSCIGICWNTEKRPCLGGRILEEPVAGADIMHRRWDNHLWGCWCRGRNTKKEMWETQSCLFGLDSSPRNMRHPAHEEEAVTTPSNQSMFSLL